MKLISLVSLLTFFSASLNAQYNNTIRTGRPGQAIGAFTVGSKVIQFQQGYDFVSSSNVSINETSHFQSNIIRVGIFENFELGGAINYESKEAKTDSSVALKNGINNCDLGVRFHINNQDGIIPTMGLQVRLKTKWVAADYRSRSVAPLMVFAAGWQISDRFSVNTNWLLSYNGNNDIPAKSYVLNFGFNLTEKLSAFVENYGEILSGSIISRFDAGLAYLVNNNCQLDIYGGYYSKNAYQSYFISGGISWRIISLHQSNINNEN